MNARTRGALGLAAAVAAAALTGCSSDDAEPTDTAGESVAATPTETTSESASATPEESPSPGTPAPTAGSSTPAPADEPTATTPPPDQGCDPDVFTPEARVDVRRSAPQLLGFTTHTLAPTSSMRSRGHPVELFEALFSGVVDQDGGEVTGRLRSAVVDRLGAGVVKDGVEELRVPLRLRNTTRQSRSYVIYAYATRSEGSWTATACPRGAEGSGPTEVRGTFAAWQRLDHGVVVCGTDPQKLSRVGRDAQLNACG